MPTRLPWALLCVLGGGLLLAAAQQVAHPSLPSILVPERNPGDQGLYHIVITTPNGTRESDRRFEVQDPQVSFDAKGRPFTARPVYETWDEVDHSGNNHTWWLRNFDDGTNDTLERMTGWSIWAGSYCSGICVSAFLFESGFYRLEAERARAEYGAQAGLCGLRNTLQSGHGAGTQPALFQGACRGNALTPVAQQKLGNRTALVYADRDHPSRQQVWMTDGLAYPVFIWSDEGNGTTVAATLVAIHAGPTQPVPAPRLPSAAPEVRLAKRTALGPALEGFDAAWPLDQAVARARAAPGGEALGRALDAGGVIAAASFSEVSDGHWRTRAWDLHANGPQATSLRVSLGQPEDGQPAAEAPFYSKDPASYTQGEQLDLTDIKPLAGLAPLEHLPAELPTVASAAERYDALRPNDLADPKANAWSFAMTCPTPDCASVDAWVAAGHDRLISKQTGVPTLAGIVPTATPSADVFMVAVKADGSTAFVDRIHQLRGAYHDTLLSTPQAGQQLRPDLDVVGWQKPAPWVAVGAGLVLILGAIATLLRGMWAGLFSRIEGDRLAHHPVRAKLLAAIAEEPGMHVSALARRLGLAPGATQHHLAKLRAAGLVTRLEQADRTRYFLPSVSPGTVAAIASARAEGAAAVLRAVLARPGLSVSELARGTGRSAGTITHHLDSLVEAGLVVRQRQGRKVVVAPTSLAHEPRVVAAASSATF